MSGPDAPGSHEKRPDSQTVAPKRPATELQADIDKGWPSVVESLKGIGIVLGSVGSVAALFYWFGFAVITSRLRVYDLFGIVRYTDEYVTEAGYQFFLDHLTFYQDPWVAFVILLVILVLFVAMPWGPFSRRTRYVDEQDTVSHRIVQWSQRGYFYLRDPHVGYSLFIVLALASVIFIVADLPLHFFRGRIDQQEKLLVEVQNVLDNSVLMFRPLPKHERSDDPALKNRRADFIRTERLEQGHDARSWVTDTQSSLRKMYPDVLEETSPEDFLKSFQKELEIRNEGPEILDNDFTSSVTYRTLRGMRVNEKINRVLEIKTDAAVNLLQNLRKTLPERETDFFSIVRYTIYFQGTNKALRDLEDLHTTIGSFSEPDTLETSKAWHHLEKVHPIIFGQFFLSFSFWVLVGIFVYLLLNSPRLLKFAHWELLYFIALLMLFLASAVTLPTAYGKYRFDFKMMRLVGVAHREASPREGSVGKKIDDLLNQNAKLYIFGSTKGNEVIMGAISPDLAPQIVIFEREAFTLVKVEPLRPGDVPYSQIGQLLGDVR